MALVPSCLRAAEDRLWHSRVSAGHSIPHLPQLTTEMSLNMTWGKPAASWKGSARPAWRAHRLQGAETPPKLSTALALAAILVVGKLPTCISPFGTETAPQGAAALLHLRAARPCQQCPKAVPMSLPAPTARSQDRQSSELHFGSASPQVTSSAGQRTSPATLQLAPDTQALPQPCTAPVPFPTPAMLHMHGRDRNYCS